jgi:subtilisin
MAMVASQFSALSSAQFSALADQLHGPEIKVIEKIMPSGLTAMASIGAPAPPAIIVAQMTHQKAQQVQAQAAGNFFVARNLPLRLADTNPFSGLSFDPSVIHSTGAQLTFTVEVLGDRGPLPNSQVFIFGGVGTTQGITDSSGRATLSMTAESAVTIQGIMVQPVSGYWNRLIRNPQLVPDSVNSVEVQPLSSTVPGLSNSDVLGWGQKAMGLDQIDPRFRGQNIRIAIIDSGVDRTHRELGNVSRGHDIPRNDPNTWADDTIGHGSHCAGIICGIWDNGFGIRGFAPDAEVHALRILPEGRTDDLIKALIYCVDNSIDVANLSLGGISGDPATVEQMRLVIEPYLAKAKSAGVTCIVAAGNSGGEVLYPASSPNVLAVSAIGKLGEFPQDSYHASLPLSPVQPDGVFFPRFSCFGPQVGVAAPGVAIISSVPGGDFVAWDGTSMAAPHVTGAAALILAHKPEFQTTFTLRNSARVDRLFSILKQSCQPLNLGDASRSGAGLPDLPKALQQQSIIQPGQPATTSQLTSAQIEDLSREIADAVQRAMAGS